MGKILKEIRDVLFIYLGLCSIFCIYEFGILNQIRKDTRVYIKKNLERILQKAEEEIGISTNERPSLNYVSTLNFILGYDEKNNTILINENFVFKHPRQNFIYRLFTRKSLALEPFLFHELIHFLEDKFLEKEGVEKENDIGKRIVFEGIAYYEQDKIYGLGIKYKKINFDEIHSNLDFIIYSVNFVKEIIEEFSSEGIKAMLLQPPEGEEVKSKELYKKKIEEILREKILNK